MKTSSAYSSSARTTVAIVLLLSGIGLLCTVPFVGTRAQLPSNITPFTGTFDAVHAYGAGCTTVAGPFIVQDTPPPGAHPQARIIVNVNATVPTNDLAITLVNTSNPTNALHTEDTGVGNEAFDYEPAGGVP